MLRNDQLKEEFSWISTENVSLPERSSGTMEEIHRAGVLTKWFAWDESQSQSG